MKDLLEFLTNDIDDIEISEFNDHHNSTPIKIIDRNKTTKYPINCYTVDPYKYEDDIYKIFSEFTINDWINFRGEIIRKITRDRSNKWNQNVLIFNDSSLLITGAFASTIKRLLSSSHQSIYNLLKKIQEIDGVFMYDSTDEIVYILTTDITRKEIIDRPKGIEVFF